MKGKDGEVQTPAMDTDNSYRREAPVSMASRSANDENDSNPPGRSSSESAFLKTRGKCLKIVTWNGKSNTGNKKYEPGHPENNTMDRRREDNTRTPHNNILR